MFHLSRFSRVPPLGHICRLTLAAVCVASLLPLPGRSQTGALRFSGAITEPVCNTTAGPASNTRSAGLRLNLNCNADQSVQIALASSADAARPLALMHAGRPLGDGQQLSLALKGRQDNLVDIGVASRDRAKPGVMVPTSLLVTLTYR